MAALVLEYRTDCSKWETRGRGTGCETTAIVLIRDGPETRTVDMKMEIRRHMGNKTDKTGKQLELKVCGTCRCSEMWDTSSALPKGGFLRDGWAWHDNADRRSNQASLPWWSSQLPITRLEKLTYEHIAFWFFSTLREKFLNYGNLTKISFSRLWIITYGTSCSSF